METENQPCTAADFLKTPTGKLFFPSKASLDWYLSKNLDELVRAGAIIYVRGKWHVFPELFNKKILELGARDALKKLAA